MATSILLCTELRCSIDVHSTSITYDMYFGVECSALSMKEHVTYMGMTSLYGLPISTEIGINLFKPLNYPTLTRETLFSPI